MKITIDLDVTPQEARAFLGLPDIEPVQQRLLAEMEERMRQYLKAMEPEAMFHTWLPAGLQNLETLQKAFWSAAERMTKGPGGRS